MIPLTNENLKSLTRAMSMALANLGFAEMSKEVLSEEKHSGLKKYVNVILKNMDGAKRDRMRGLFSSLGLVEEKKN